MIHPISIRLSGRMFFLIVLFGSISLFAQAPKINFEAERGLTQVTSNNFEATRVSLSFEGLHFINVETEKGLFSELIMPGGHSVGALGTPKLPASNKLIEVPFGAEVSVRVLGYTTEHYRLADFGVEHPLMPVQPSLRKDQDISEVPFEYKPQIYNKRSFIEPEIASVEVLGVMRGQRLGRLTVAPVHYNPADNSIKVFNNIELEIQYTGADQALTREIKASTFSPWFNVVYDQVINRFDTRDIFDDYPDLTKNPVKMVVVSHDDFQETLQPFIEWKTKQGFEIIEAYTSEVGGSASAIQNFIHDQYDAGTPESPAPTFVIVVGDPGKLPASATGSASNQVTDLYYASVDGDMFPEMYIGRLSARNVQELQNQLDKILYYQQYEFTDPSYLNDVTLIAGHDNFWNPNVGQPTVHYATQNYFNAANGFANVNAFLNSYTGVYEEERISVSLINYTAHCSPTGWGNPLLRVSDIHNMTNSGKYPLAIGNCCESAQFSHPESIGEAWVRAENKGAVAYIGSAPNTHWFEDFYWAVGAFPISGNNGGYVPSVDETTMGTYDAPFVSDYVAVASVKFVGNLAITEAHLQNYPTHSNVQWYWEGYHTFGDPSTVIYLTEGSENVVTHMPILPIGLDTYTVEALPGSYVGISMNGVLHGAAFVDESGEVEVPIDPILDGGDVTIVVTKPQYIPYIVEVPAAALEGSFVVIDHFVINDAAGTEQANYGDSFTIDLTLKNVGADPVDEVTATLSGGDEFISLENGDAVVFNGMDAGETGNTSTVADAFAFEVSLDAPNQHQTTFVLTVTDGANEWTSNLRITAHAPVFEINPEYVLDDSIDGDGNGRLDPGETGSITFELTNKGDATAINPMMQLMGNSAYFSIEEAELELAPLAAGETMEVEFIVMAHPSAPEGTMVDLEVHVEDGHHDEAFNHLFIGQVPETTIGEGTDIPAQYPFYNYYRANRSQMLYHASELGEGDKIITEMGMEVVHITSTSQHQVFPNFVVRVKHTDLNALGTSFVSMDDATVVFQEDNHQMPLEVGWHIWDIENFGYDGTSNLIVEVVWGMLDSWCALGDHYRVHGSTKNETRAVYGRSDWQAIPPYNGNSKILPNLYLAFAAEETEDTREIEFVVKDTEDNLLQGAGITIGSLTMLTNAAGETSFTLIPGAYDFSVAKTGFVTYTDNVLITDATKTISVVMAPVTGAEHTLTVLVNGQGSVQVNGSVYFSPVIAEHGTVLTLEAIAENNWVFDSWSGDINSETSSIDIVLDSDKEVTAHFSPETVGSNILLIRDATAPTAGLVTIELEIINEDDFVGFSLEIPLPEGFGYVEGTEQLHRNNGHFLVFAILEGNVASIVSAAIATTPFPGNDGVIVSFDLQTPEDEGTYVLDILKAGISDSTGTNILTGQIPGTVVIEDMQDGLYLYDLYFPDGIQECFSALSSIITAGVNGDFIIYDGGSVELAAGKSIHLLPGTIVEKGGNLLARIALHEDDFCGIPRAKEITRDLVPSKEDVVSADPPYDIRENGFFNLYPNPTDGIFTLELATPELAQGITAEVLSITGHRVFSKELPPQRLHTLSLEGQQPGIYIIRIMKGDKVGVERLIKR